MKAIIAQGPDALHYTDKPPPVAGPGQVLVQVYAAGINPVDWKVLGRASAVQPMTPGCDFSGVISAVGAGVSQLKIGDAVYGSVGIISEGTYAECIAVAADIVALKPELLSHTEAAAVPVAATTAWQALFDYANLRAGQRVLVHAAAGGVGQFAVQLAKWKGAYVIGTASGHNQQFVKDLGADEFIDYTVTAFEQVLRDVDVVLDTVGGPTADKSWQVLKKGGFFVSIVGSANEIQAQRHLVRSANFMVTPDAAQLAQIAYLLDGGQLKVLVQQAFPLAQAAAAQALSKQGHVRSKLVLLVQEAH